MFRYKSFACKNCTLKNRMDEEVKNPEWKRHHKKMCAAAARSTGVTDEWRALRKRCACAKHRCCSDHPNYGARGIKFNFSSPSEMARYIVATLGYPNPKDTLDRINNDGHYEKGNLRWATMKVQCNNKRQYKVLEYGQRVRDMQAARPDYSVSTIRLLIKTGLTDQEIIDRVKWDGCGKSLRH